MNLSEFVKAIAGDLLERAKDGMTDVGYETTFDTMIASYKKFCKSFSERYLSRRGTDKALLHSFRERFMRMLKLSAISMDELDTYVVGKYVDRRGDLIEIYVDAKRLRRELKSSVKQIEFKKKERR